MNNFNFWLNLFEGRTKMTLNIDPMISINTKAKKDLRKIPHNDVVRIEKKINELANNPYDVKETGKNIDGTFRSRIGNYRVLYNIIMRNKIEILRVGLRKDIYTGLTPSRN